MNNIDLKNDGSEEFKARTQTMTIAHNILRAAEKEIASFLNGTRNSEKFGITQLSKDVAKALGCPFTLAYALISDYIANRTDIKVQMGRNGGIVKVIPTMIMPLIIVDDKEE